MKLNFLEIVLGLLSLTLLLFLSSAWSQRLIWALASGAAKRAINSPSVLITIVKNWELTEGKVAPTWRQLSFGNALCSIFWAAAYTPCLKHAYCFLIYHRSYLIPFHVDPFMIYYVCLFKHHTSARLPARMHCWLFSEHNAFTVVA